MFPHSAGQILLDCSSVPCTSHLTSTRPKPLHVVSTATETQEPPSMLLQQEIIHSCQCTVQHTRGTAPFGAACGCLLFPASAEVMHYHRLLPARQTQRHPTLFWQQALLESIPMPPIISLMLPTALDFSKRFAQQKNEHNAHSQQKCCDSEMCNACKDL